MPAFATIPILNEQLVSARRLVLGLTQRALARATGLSAPTISRIEAGESAADLTLADLRRLADTLDVELWELVIRPADPRPPTGPDDAQVETILADAGRLLRVDELADALGWPLVRVLSGLEALEHRLSGTGQRLHRRQSGEVALRPRSGALSPAARVSAVRAGHSHRGMKTTTARLLRDLTQTPDLPVPTGNAERVSAGELINAGLAELAGGRLRLSEAARFSLMRDDGHHPSRPRGRQSVRAKRPR